MNPKFEWPEKCKNCWCHFCGRWETCDVGDMEYVWPCRGCGDAPRLPLSEAACGLFIHPGDDLADQAATAECKTCWCYTCANWPGCEDFAAGCADCSRGRRHKPKEEPVCAGYERQRRERKDRKARVRRDRNVRQNRKR